MLDPFRSSSGAVSLGHFCLHRVIMRLLNLLTWNFWRLLRRFVVFKYGLCKRNFWTEFISCFWLNIKSVWYHNHTILNTFCKRISPCHTNILGVFQQIPTAPSSGKFLYPIAAGLILAFRILPPRSWGDYDERVCICWQAQNRQKQWQPKRPNNGDFAKEVYIAQSLKGPKKVIFSGPMGLQIQWHCWGWQKIIGAKVYSWVKKLASSKLR